MSSQRFRLRTATDRAAEHPWLTVLAVLCLAILVLVLLWDWNWFKGPVERQVQARTGRVLDIGGDLDVDLGRVTVIRAERLRFANAAWAKEGTMASADLLELRVEPLKLLFQRKLSIPLLRLVKPDVLLQTGAQGNNWTFESSGGGDGPRFRRLWIDQGHLRFDDPVGKTAVDITVASQRGNGAQGSAPIAIEGGGRWRDNPFTLEGRAESPLELTDSTQPYRIDLRAAAGSTRAHARGALLDPFALENFDLQLALSGADLEDLFPLLGIALPHTPRYSFDGRLARRRTHWTYDGFSGKVGDSDLGGSVAVETGGKRTDFRADLVSKLLDFDDLGGFVGAPPQDGPGETPSAALEAEAASERAAGRILPDTPYDLAKLRAMDADVRWKAARIEAPGWPLEDMDAHLLLKDGLVRLDPLNFGVAGGDVRSTIRMDAREDVIRTNAKVALRGLEIGRLMPDAKLAQDAVGRIGGDIAITGRGNSIAGMLGTANGDIALGMGRGSVSNLLMELAGIDIYEALKYLIGKDRKVAIRCAFGDFKVTDGVMDTRALAFDTSDTIIIGKGKVSLREEALDLELRPRPKDRSFLTLRSPLVVGGTFADPSFRPDLARLGLRGAIALALGSIAPPAALLATIDLGGGEDSGCGGDYAR